MAEFSEIRGQSPTAVAELPEPAYGERRDDFGAGPCRANRQSRETTVAADRVPVPAGGRGRGPTRHKIRQVPAPVRLASHRFDGQEPFGPDSRRKPARRYSGGDRGGPGHDLGTGLRVQVAGGSGKRSIPPNIADRSFNRRSKVSRGKLPIASCSPILRSYGSPMRFAWDVTF